MPYFSKNPIVINRDAEGASFVRLELHIESSYQAADYSLVHSQKLAPDTTGFCKFRIDSVLDAFLEDGRVPQWSYLAPYFKSSSYCVRYFRPYVVHIAADGTEAAPVELSTSVVMLGSRSWNEFVSGLGIPLGYFLHSRPSELTIRGGFNYLSFYYEIATGLSQIEYTFYAQDGTPRIVTTTYTGGSFQGVVHADLNQYPTVDEKSRFSVRVIQGDWGDPLGPVYFNFDSSYCATERQFVFRNSKGGFETLTTTGLATEILSAERSVADRITSPEYAIGSGKQFVWQQETSCRMVVNTGWLPNQAQARWLAFELMQTREIYEMMNGQPMQIILNTKSLEAFKDEDYLKGFALEYNYAFPVLGFPI